MMSNNEQERYEHTQVTQTIRNRVKDHKGRGEVRRRTQERPNQSKRQQHKSKQLNRHDRQGPNIARNTKERTRTDRSNTRRT